MKQKLAALRDYVLVEKHRRALECAALGVIVALIVALCITSNARANMHREYAAVRDRAGANLYSNLNLMTQTFDMVDVPTADVQNAILPQMKELFHAAVALNQLLSQAYSSRYALLSDADIASVESAFDAYDEAYRTESSTDLARSNMQACMSRVRELLSTRYVSGVLKPTR